MRKNDFTLCRLLNDDGLYCRLPKMCSGKWNCCYTQTNYKCTCQKVRPSTSFFTRPEVGFMLPVLQRQRNIFELGGRGFGLCPHHGAMTWLQCIQVPCMTVSINGEALASSPLPSWLWRMKMLKVTNPLRAHHALWTWLTLNLNQSIAGFRDLKMKKFKLSSH